jgi:hypothetical protein
VHGIARAAALPVPPKTFDTTYAAPTGATLTVAAGGDLRAALEKAQPGDTIVLEAGATWNGPIKLPNKTGGSGWIYVVSSRLSSLPPPGTRVGPANAANMPKILAPNSQNAVVTEANSHNFRFVGIEFATVPGSKQIYNLVVIGNKDTSPATLPSHIVFDRCYVHGEPNANVRRGIDMEGAYVAVVDSYISNFQEDGIDSQGLLAFNTTGPIQIRNNYIEAATNNVLFGGVDSRSPELVPADIEISNNLFFKPWTEIPKKYPMKNLLEFKDAKRVLVVGNVFQNNPAAAQPGFAILVTPRAGPNAPWIVTSDIEFRGNTLINVGSGFSIMGHSTPPTQMTERILIHDNLIGVTGLGGADGRAFQFVFGGSDYTVDHNTIINTASPPGSPASDLAMVQSPAPKINNFVFTNNLSTHTRYGFFGSGLSEGTRALDGYFTNWTFSKNAIVDAPAASYPAGNFFPTGVAAVGFTNYTGGNFVLAAHSPYKGAGTDGLDIGATSTPRTNVNVVLPNPPSNVVVK